MEPVYFRGLTLGKGTYSIPLEPSPPYGDSWKGLTHSSLEHPDPSETSPSARAPMFPPYPHLMASDSRVSPHPPSGSHGLGWGMSTQSLNVPTQA